MHFTTKYLLSIGTFAAALVLAGSHASAQRATFTLPFEAHVGNVTLQPGEYRLRVPVGTSNIRAVYLEGNGKVQAALPAAIDNHADGEGGYFEFVNVGGTYYAKKFVSGVTSTTYEFNLPKAARSGVMANSRTTSISVTGGASN